MYKDKDKQREANRQAQARFKAKMAAGIDEGIAMQKCLGITEGITEGIRSEGITGRVLPERTTQGNIRVSKPSDADYVPMCETTRAFIDNRDKRPNTAKRGKDIKCFEDLPPDVQRTIDRMSIVDGRIDKDEKTKRTAAAIKYQQMFSDEDVNSMDGFEQRHLSPALQLRQGNKV